MRIWLIKITIQFDLLIDPVNLRIAWLIRRACTPTLLSPISPSSSDLGVRAATESTTTMLTAPDRTNVSVISRACSPVSGWEISSSSRSTPNFFAYCGSRACSASTNAHTPPFFCSSATQCNVRVVLPELSGPYISTIRPLGNPPIPKAISKPNEPVDVDSIS